MKTTIIITTYNRPDALKKVLDGFLNQTLPPIEIIIADDGSGDETKKVVKNFLNKPAYPVYHVWQKDNGFRLAEIRNKAINHSLGEYIILIDGDCIPEKHFIEDHISLASKGYFFQGKRVLVNKKITNTFSCRQIALKGQLLWQALSGNISNAHHIFRMPFFPASSKKSLSGIRGCNMGFFKDDLITVNGFNQDFIGWGREDSEIVVRLYKFGIKRKEHPFMAICFHLWHDEGNRTNLTVNDEILEKTKKSKNYFCTNGLINKNDNKNK